MYCGSNKLALASQRQIAEALMRLIGEKPYRQISVSELCRNAGISRQTFYSLFTSRDNVMVFTLQERCCYEPDGAQRGADGGLRGLCRGYAQYVLHNRDILRLLVENGIDYLLYDSLREGLSSSGCFLPELDAGRRAYAVDFVAGGITGVVRRYVRAGCRSGAAEMESLLESLLGGELFRTR